MPRGKSPFCRQKSSKNTRIGYQLLIIQDNTKRLTRPSQALLNSFGSRLDVFNRSCRFSKVMPSRTSIGSMTFPRLLLILRPCASRTIGCKYTCCKPKSWLPSICVQQPQHRIERTLNGSFPVSSVHIITMRATQKKRLSWPRCDCSSINNS